MVGAGRDGAAWYGCDGFRGLLLVVESVECVMTVMCGDVLTVCSDNTLSGYCGLDSGFADGVFSGC